MKTNTELLMQLIEDSGLKINYIAEKCGVTRQGFYNKLNGKTEFTAPEIAAIRSVLHLTLTQTRDIFLI